MASITLTKVWIAESTDLTTQVQLDTGPINEEVKLPGQIRRYAGGVYRTITAQGTETSVSFPALAMNRADLDALRSWAGKTVLYRDPLGRKFFGTFLAPKVSERPIGQTGVVWALQLDITRLSFTEEV